MEKILLNLKKNIDSYWNMKDNLNHCDVKFTVEKVIEYLDKGKIRVISYSEENQLIINEWIKKAILIYFQIKKVKLIEFGSLKFFDKIPLKKNYNKIGVRVVPTAIARYGSYISKNVILMPSYVNIGAFIGKESMIDTWATIGSCAQIGDRVHISGGVGIGGVLEPLQSSPVIIGNNAFIGSRCIIVEGVIVEEEAVLGANVVITSSTKIIDVTNDKPIISKGLIPKRSVVIPGSYPKKFKSGTYYVPCALIIGKRKESTDKKTSLNKVLREYNISV
ncbi:2,3,4,5-tetrahydropyridine-2,6-dicarboxylate N-succinyltransferase [Candidatus Karelsulcia muelleri]|uniref:2,3,4,5-tetrahydropyridine-2,6-dicarboxylate N-succinyltransferase n=1 Tax=Candidatus Karelsulcia muelleri TaxID=336810 RepID=UPI0004F87945|nr:2,3,4,5-tetrahydropyridine-2,6-dicarboxylate N-succinyltransferase [Candidatus Karelsulcia muelleri]AIN47653.1 2,3,4,5-tetrahydropyridine-2,6-dicarboxylate N-succinyltransferase [Candidatus Karelsulcia muelleri]MBU6942250.1 2,3,4,5-tetrahydropyridine-2,6-dicarboxylate N-succinyltransferase [Candidatus Karelsulcia muelleri]